MCVKLSILLFFFINFALTYALRVAYEIPNTCVDLDNIFVSVLFCSFHNTNKAENVHTCICYFLHC